MASEELHKLSKVHNLEALLESNLDKYTIEHEVENVLKSIVKDIRQDKGLSTTWDNDLSHILMPALMNYEMERVGGKTFGEQDF